MRTTLRFCPTQSAIRRAACAVLRPVGERTECRQGARCLCDFVSVPAPVAVRGFSPLFTAFRVRARARARLRRRHFRLRTS